MQLIFNHYYEDIKSAKRPKQTKPGSPFFKNTKYYFGNPKGIEIEI